MRHLCVLLCSLLLLGAPLCSVDAQEDQTLLGDAVLPGKLRNPTGPMLMGDITWNPFKKTGLLGDAPPAKPSKTEASGPHGPPLNRTADATAFNGSHPQPPPLNDSSRPNKTAVALAEVLETESAATSVVAAAVDAEQTQEVSAAMEAKTTKAQDATQWMQANMQTGVIVAVGGLVLIVAGVALRARSAANEQQAKQQREDHHLLESLLYNDMDYAAM